MNRWPCVIPLLALVPIFGTALADGAEIGSAAGELGPGPLEAPQQSTTGPVPPPGVAPKVLEPAPPGERGQIVLTVPAYLWRHGCGPTALGMVLGYYDVNGYPDLFPGDASTQTEDVNQAIASQRNGFDPGHYEDYSLPLDYYPDPIEPDMSEPPVGDEHPDDSIADLMRTSWSAEDNYYGWSWSTHMGPAYQGYVQMETSYISSWSFYSTTVGNLTWGVLTGEIDSGRPLVFLVDTNADGYADHFVTVVGYRDPPDWPTQQYGCLDTWAPAAVVRWCDFSAMAVGQSWGVWGGWTFGMDGPFVLVGSLSGGELVLSWTAVADAAAYWVYGADNLAYFEPALAPPYHYRLAMLPPGTTNFSSPYGIGDPANNWTYLVIAVGAGGQVLGFSNRFGEHDFDVSSP